MDYGLTTKGRPCSVPGCHGWLSVLVPPKVTMCGRHQFLSLQKERLIEKLRDKFQLSSSDVKFLKRHLDWECNCPLIEIAKYTNTSRSTLWSYLRKGILPHQKEGRRVFISAEDAARIIDIKLHRVLLFRAAQEIGIRHQTALNWARRGYFGSISYDFHNRLLVRKETVAIIKKQKERIKKRHFWQAHRAGWYLAPNEVNAPEMARHLGVGIRTVYDWIKKGKFEVRKKGCHLVITGPPKLVQLVQSKREKDIL